MAPKSKRVKFIDDEAEVCDSSDEQEEEVDDGLGDFLFDDPEELVLDTPPRPLVSATDSGCIDREKIINKEEIQKYVESLKRRARESNRVVGSSMQDKSLIPRRLELWMLPVPAGMEKILAESLLEISRETHEDCGIKTYHVPYHPRRIYIETPGIVEIQEFMKFSAYGSLVSRATRIFDDIDRDFLHGSSIPDVPCPGSWVRIIPACLYKGDLALVVFTPSEGDVVSITVVPRFDISQNKKRKAHGLFARAGPAPALLDPEFLAKFPLNENNIHPIGSRMFHRTGLEVLQAPTVHVLKIEPRPTEAELFLFQSCFERLDITYDTENLIRNAVNKAFRNESRWLWRTGDRVRILRGNFMHKSCSIHEIDEANRTAVVEFGSPKPTLVEVSMEDLEREFLVGDQVRVALGKSKGRTGSIVEITDNTFGTIVEGTANQLIELQVSLLYLESHTLVPSFASTPHPAASSISKPKPSHEPEAAKGHPMRSGRDSRIGREAAVYIGQMKGYRGLLLEIGPNFGKIECPGRQPPTFTAPLKHLVLIDTPTHNLAGTKLDEPYVARDLMRPEPSLPRSSTPPPPVDEVPEFTSEERGGAPIEPGSGAFLRDPKICANLDGFHIWVGFHVTYENGSYTTRHGHTPLPDKFRDANGQCSLHEVCIIVTDHRTAIPSPRRVELHHLKPVPPKKKGDWIIIISGDHQGVVAEVIACKTKTSKAEVAINGTKITFNFSDICRLTRPV